MNGVNDDTVTKLAVSEEKLTIIITMAGIGSRFKQVGYNVPKYMIEAKGQTLFEWSLDSLADCKNYSSKYIFIVRREDDASDFIKQTCLKYMIDNIEILEIDYPTDGQATTAILAIQYCNTDVPVLIYNIDTYVEPYEMKFEELKGDGHIPCFHAEGTHWSFVKLEHGRVTEVREKVRISENCTLGAYYFSSAGLYKSLYNEYYSDDSNMENNEKYIAPLYDYMVKKGLEVTISIVDRNKVHVLGTPEELQTFLDN